jgi:hypothetical protein
MGATGKLATVDIRWFAPPLARAASMQGGIEHDHVT